MESSNQKVNHPLTSKEIERIFDLCPFDRDRLKDPNEKKVILIEFSLSVEPNFEEHHYFNQPSIEDLSKDPLWWAHRFEPEQKPIQVYENLLCTKCSGEAYEKIATKLPPLSENEPIEDFEEKKAAILERLKDPNLKAQGFGGFLKAPRPYRMTKISRRPMTRKDTRNRCFIGPCNRSYTKQGHNYSQTKIR